VVTLSRSSAEDRSRLGAELIKANSLHCRRAPDTTPLRAHED